MSLIASQNTLLQMENNTSKVRYEAGRKNLGSGELDKNAFLTLLMAQLQHQDPMNPMEDAEFISQQAQFTQIEKLDNLIAAVKGNSMLSEAGSMVGKTVEVVLESGETRIGRVDSVKIGTDGVGLIMGDSTFTMDQVVQIFADAPVE